METMQWKEGIIRRINLLCHDGKITELFARAIIQDSAWWEKHPTAGPVRAPGHADNIRGQNGSYSLTFGSNTFLITSAVCRCCYHIKNWLNEHAVLPKSLSDLYSKLTNVLRGAISNHEGEEYDYYYGGAGERILFGVHAISANGFIRYILTEIKLHELYSYIHPYNYSHKSVPSISHASHSTPNPTPAEQVAKQNLSVCPWCQAKVSSKKLQKHMRSRCPKRPQK